MWPHLSTRNLSRLVSSRNVVACCRVPLVIKSSPWRNTRTHPQQNWVSVWLFHTWRQNMLWQLLSRREHVLGTCQRNARTVSAVVRFGCPNVASNVVAEMSPRSSVVLFVSCATKRARIWGFFALLLLTMIQRVSMFLKFCPSWSSIPSAHGPTLDACIRHHPRCPVRPSKCFGNSAPLVVENIIVFFLASFVLRVYLDVLIKTLEVSLTPKSLSESTADCCSRSRWRSHTSPRHAILWQQSVDMWVDVIDALSTYDILRVGRDTQ